MALNVEHMHKLDAVCIHCGKTFENHIGYFCPDENGTGIIPGTKFEEKKNE